MIRKIGIFAAIAGSATAAHAGGIERTTQSVNVLFEEGRYLEFGATIGSVDISGVGPNSTLMGLANTGDIADSFFDLSAAYKADINETWSYAIIYDQPFGADVTYPSGTGHLFQGSNATFNSNAITGLLQYNVGNGFSVHGGLRAQTIDAEVSLPFAGYTAEGDRELGFGYVAGVAYEKPEIALRVALTFNSSINYDLETTEFIGGMGPIPSETDIETPQSVNLEFQSGVAEDTLVFGSIRWVEWTAFNTNPQTFASSISTNGRALVDFLDNRTTFTLGVGRRLNENWSVLGSLTYEDSTGSTTGNLAPTDGQRAVGIGAIYTKDNMRITGGVRYIDIGDATSAAPINGQFTDSSAIVAGVRVGYSF